MDAQQQAIKGLDTIPRKHLIEMLVDLKKGIDEGLAIWTRSITSHGRRIGISSLSMRIIRKISEAETLPEGESLNFDLEEAAESLKVNAEDAHTTLALHYPLLLATGREVVVYFPEHQNKTRKGMH